MQRGTEMFFTYQLREDRDPLELWSANYTYVNERLARHYGIPNVSGPEFRRVAFPGPDRAGLTWSRQYPHVHFPLGLAIPGRRTDDIPGRSRDTDSKAFSWA